MPINKQTLQDLFDSLEAILVNTFRLCETLHHISQQERQALLESKMDVLLSITKDKSNIITEMETNDEARKVVVKQLAQELGIDDGQITISVLVSKADHSIDTSKITRLQQGILTLQAEIRELNNGNFALATLNVQRLESVQEYILGLFTSPVYYHPTIKAPFNEAPASWGRDHLA